MNGKDKSWTKVTVTKSHERIFADRIRIKIRLEIVLEELELKVSNKTFQKNYLQIFQEFSEVLKKFCIYILYLHVIDTRNLTQKIINVSQIKSQLALIFYPIYHYYLFIIRSSIH